MPRNPRSDVPLGQFRIAIRDIIGEERYRELHLTSHKAKNWICVYIPYRDIRPWEVDSILVQAKRKFGLTVRHILIKDKWRHEFRIINPVLHGDLGGINTMGW